MTAARFLARKSSCCNLRNQSIRGEDRRSKIASSAPRMAPKRKLIDQQQHPIGVGDRYTCIHRWCGYIMVVLPSAWSGLHPMPTSVLIGPTIGERWQTMSGQSWPELRNLCNFRAPIVQIMASHFLDLIMRSHAVPREWGVTQRSHSWTTEFPSSEPEIATQRSDNDPKIRLSRACQRKAKIYISGG